MHTARFSRHGSYGPSQTTMRKAGTGYFDNGWYMLVPKDHYLIQPPFVNAHDGCVSKPVVLLYEDGQEPVCAFCETDLFWRKCSFWSNYVHILYRDGDKNNLALSNLVIGCKSCTFKIFNGTDKTTDLMRAYLFGMTLSEKQMDMFKEETV